jgi:dihydropteroate synthase
MQNFSPMIWQTKNGQLDLSSRGVIMGILNVTPDSFSDGGKFHQLTAAVDRGVKMAAEGARILDIGGESTRPGADAVETGVELQRVIPVIKQLASKTDALISIDTSKPEVAAAAVEAGASIINDVTGLRNTAMREVAANTGAGVVIMHMQGTPRDMQIAPHYDDVAGEIRHFFRQAFDGALASGIDPARIVLDPGIGFGKTVAHNLKLIKNLGSLRIESRPLLLGVSRKGFLREITGLSEMEERIWPTVAITAFAREKGANIFRVHDVKANHAALKMAEALAEA